MYAPITLERTIHYGDVKVFVGHDGHERRFIGIGVGLGERGNVVFMQVQEETVLQLEAGQVDLYTVIRQRCVGPIVELSRDAIPGLRTRHGASACA